MKKLFLTGIIGLLLFELLNVYLIMPMPGSQRMNSISMAYFLYQWRWVFRVLFVACIVIGLVRSTWKRKWVPLIPIVIILAIVYMVNFKMAADHMFYQPKQLMMVASAANSIDSNRLVLGIERDGEARAYPIQFLGYHHQVQDSIAGKPVLVTYCTVCRTGRVYEPIVNGKHSKFRLVGMDHFNAMLEDEGTKSWWRQATGEAVSGELKGQRLPEFFSTQTSLAEWLRSHPRSLVMQADPAFKETYGSTFKFESGTSKKKLTGTDSLSWQDKSWVIGIVAGNESKAYDWNRLKKERLIEDKLGHSSLLLVLAEDNRSFFAFERPDEQTKFSLHDDTLVMPPHHFTINGKGIDTHTSLKPLQAYQEFWHSWRTFHPQTKKY